MKNKDGLCGMVLERLRLLGGYAVEDTLREISERYGIDSGEIVRLNSNENFFMPAERIRELLKEVAEECDLRVYPLEEEYQLKEMLADYVHLAADHIIVANGSDELIQQISWLFLENGEQALSVMPTFSMYRHSVCLSGAEYFEVPLMRDFSIDVDRILNVTTPRTKVLFLCSPNNPTANEFEPNAIRSLVEKFPGLIVIDEAYVEFAKRSMCSLLDEFDNVIILRTFSKAFGLAGVRLGYALASETLATEFSEKAQPPYPVGSIALKMGLKIMSNVGLVKDAVEQLKAERKTLVAKLNEIEGVKAFDSQTNFILFRTGTQSNRIYKELLSKGVWVKNLGQILCYSNCLRATVGKPQMNLRLLSALEGIRG